MPETPEQRARREIDAGLMAAGWILQNRDELDITAGRGIAVREFTMKSGFGFADYVLYLDRKAVGAVEAAHPTQCGGTKVDRRIQGVSGIASTRTAQENCTALSPLLERA